MTERKSLLFISPILPQSHGNGLAMRAALWLSALSRHYQISLLVVPLGDPKQTAGSFEFAHCVDRVKLISLDRFTRTRATVCRFVRKTLGTGVHRMRESDFLTPGVRRRVAAAFRADEFDSVFVFRLYMTSLISELLPACSGIPKVFLDLDDIESDTRSEIAKVYCARGLKREGRLIEEEATAAERMAREVLKHFDSVFVCSADDKATLIQRYQLSNVAVVPNAVAIPTAGERREIETPFTFLFVGNLNYFPNLDGALFFAKEILPKVQKLTKHPVQFKIIGSGNAGKLQELSMLPRVQVVGYVSDLSRHYLSAGAVVVPLRAGGGTRIKLLEAFSFKLPVVSTPEGADGIAVRDGEQLFVARTAEEYAARCASLVEDPSLAARLGSQGYDLVTKRYSHSAIIREINLLTALYQESQVALP